MKNKKLTYLILITLVTIFLSVPLVKAETLWYTMTNMYGLGTGYQGIDDAVGTQLTGNNEFAIRAIFDVHLHDFEGYVDCIIVDSDNYDFNAPNATSFNSYDLSTIDGYYQLEFLFTGQLNVTSTHNWYILIRNTGVINKPFAFIFGSGNVFDNVVYFVNGALYHTSTMFAPTCAIYTTQVAPEASPTPLPTPTPATASGELDTLIDDLTAFLIPLIIMVSPAFLLWWLGGRGKWPLLIGLAIGTSLGYIFVTEFPLWLVFLVAIGIIGMAYSDVSSGGSYT